MRIIMKDKDKLFLVVYFGVNNSYSKDYNFHTLVNLENSLLTSLDDSVKLFVIPQLMSDTIKLELLNVEKCSNEKIDEIMRTYELVINKIKNEDK